jgi:hypothetical protein
MIEMLAGQLGDQSIEQLLKSFETQAKLDGTYFFCNQESLTQIAKLIQGVGRGCCAGPPYICVWGGPVD